MITVSDARIVGEYTVSLDISGAPLMRTTHSTARFLPDRVRVQYVIDQDDARWECTEATVSGLKVKRDGSPGKLTGDHFFLMFTCPKLPDWLACLIDAHRPAKATPEHAAGHTRSEDCRCDRHAHPNDRLTAER